MKDILRELNIAVCIGSAYVVFSFSAKFSEFLEFGDNFIIAAPACYGLAQSIVNLPAPIEAHNDIVHLLIGEFYNLVVNEHAVGGEGKAKVLARLLLS